MSEWINVKDRLPPIEKDVLLHILSSYPPTIFVGFRVRYEIEYAIAELEGYTSCSEKITHWMPLPNPPKEKNYE